MNKNREQHLLQERILRRCHHGDGTAKERYDDCVKLLKEAEQTGVIAGSEWNEWVQLVTATLGI